MPAGHLLGAAVTFVSSAAGSILIAKRMRLDPRWQTLSSYTLASGIAMVFLFLISIGLARPEDALLHPWPGLLQRYFMAVWLSCTVIMALRLWRIAKTANILDPTGGPPRTHS